MRLSRFPLPLPPHRPARLLRGILVVLLVAVMAFPAAASEVRGVVSFAQDDLSNDWRRAQVEAVRRALASHPGVDFRVSDAHGSLALQVKHIEDWVARDVDVLVTSPLDSRAMAPVIRQAVDAGTPVVLLSRGVEGDGYTSFIHPDNTRIARAAGQEMASRLAGEGRVLMLAGQPGATTTIRRARAFMEVMDQHPGIRVERRRADYLRGEAIRVVEAILAERGGFPFEAIYAQSDSMASGARMALEGAGIDVEGLTIIGIDYIAEARKAIRKGRQDMSFTYPTGGREGARVVLDLLRGQSVAREITLESVRVTEENVDQVEPIF